MSTTYTATIILFITAIANIFGFEVVEEQLQTFIEMVVAVVSAVWILVERYKKGGITSFGFRRK